MNDFTGELDLGVLSEAITKNARKKSITNIALTGCGLLLVLALSLQLWPLLLLASSGIVLGFVLRREALKQRRLLEDNPNLEAAKAYPAVADRILQRADKFIDAAQKLIQNQDKLDALEERINSERGDLLLETQPIPGVELKIWERWIWTNQAVDGSLEDAVATFVDNTSKFARHDGSVTEGSSRGSISANTYTWQSNQQGMSTSSTSGWATTSSRAVTQNLVSVHTAGSASVHVQGKHLNVFITFNDPHFAAGIANTINGIGKSFKELPLLKKSVVADIKQARTQAIAAWESLYSEALEILEDLPQSASLAKAVDQTFGKIGLSSDEIRSGTTLES